jgi:hypothetical protein
MIGFAILIFIVYLFIKADLMGGLVIISVALLIDGIFVSGIFAFAGLSRGADQLAVITQLYTADLLGGCFGSLAASLILIPVYGFFISLLILIVLSLCSLILVL